VNKSKFQELVKNPYLISEKDLTKLAEFTSEHPYSQIIHLLNVHGRKILNKPDFEKALNLAAIYSNDRSVLHSIIQGVKVDQNSYPQTSSPEDPEHPADGLEEPVVEETSDFEWVNEDLIEREPLSQEATSGKEEQQEITEPVKSDPKEEVADQSPESAMEELVEEKGLDQEIEASGIHAELMDNLSQLQESRKQYEGQNDDTGGQKGRKEQIKIVDNFIKNSPVLSKPNLSAESEMMSQKDLAKDSGKFSDELASENLAKIFIKQGKRKDAEKIYKKLIGKFPQKKTYFANKIEKLKKK